MYGNTTKGNVLKRSQTDCIIFFVTIRVCDLLLLIFALSLQLKIIILIVILSIIFCVLFVIIIIMILVIVFTRNMR